mmetsp:Transcript_42022/g.88936  ORF Transcript_42022/g.88936 Transcript_42022/m.88936 type:complete len:111 (+) Transcript_42022:1-333(+)
METADVILMDSDLQKLALGVELGHLASRKIRQNILISLLTKAAVLVATAAGVACLGLAVVVDVGSMLAVTLNGMTVLSKSPPPRPKHKPAGGKGRGAGGKSKYVKLKEDV